MASTSSSLDTPYEIPNQLKNQIIISSPNPRFYFLGPMGNLDPTDIICSEANRISFKNAQLNASDWTQSFRFFPARMVGQIGYSVPPLDILMLTGLNIMTHVNPLNLRGTFQHRLQTKGVGGWSGDISHRKDSGTADHREHSAFLNLWLERFVFCGQTLGPTTNFENMAERLADGGPVPLDFQDYEAPSILRLDEVQTRQMLIGKLLFCPYPVFVTERALCSIWKRMQRKTLNEMSNITFTISWMSPIKHQESTGVRVASEWKGPSGSASTSVGVEDASGSVEGWRRHQRDAGEQRRETADGGWDAYEQ
uniref:Aminotransferase-like plant mobile domain-containing protein n=1 Tax=Oryza brachyantha TaxID=4533 RepID=J3LCN8_ORYBR